MVTVRRAEQGDEDALSAIGSETFVATFGHLYALRDLTAFLETSHSVLACRQVLDDPQKAAWFAEAPDGDIIGYAVAGPCSLPVPGGATGRDGELSRFYILEPWQGRGVAEPVFTVAMEFLCAGFDRIFLSVYAGNTRAQRFYAKRGFVKIHEYFYMVGDHADPEWIMEKSR